MESSVLDLLLSERRLSCSSTSPAVRLLIPVVLEKDISWLGKIPLDHAV